MINHLAVRRRLARVALSAALAIGLAGCGNNGDAARGAGQSVAQVDGQDVTVHQLNYRLRNLQAPAGADQQAATRAAADQLVDRELLVKRALARKLDRDPAVMLAVEEMRRDILATAYLESIAAAAATPTDSELHAAYDASPGKYAQRKLFLVRQVQIDNSVTRADIEAFDKAEGKVTAKALVTWLQQRGARFTVTINTWPADQLPDDLTAKLEKLPKGNAIMIAAPNGLAVNFLVDVLDAPQTFEQAREGIAKTLLDKRQLELKETELAHLRSAATITWLGDFARDKPAPADTAKPSTADGKGDDKTFTEGIKGLR